MVDAGSRGETELKGLLESETKAKLRKHIAETPHTYQFWPVQGGYGASTVDCLAWWEGEPHAIECKRQFVEKPSARQRNVMAEMRKAGVYTWVVTLDENAELKWIKQTDAS